MISAAIGLGWFFLTEHTQKMRFSCNMFANALFWYDRLKYASKTQRDNATLCPPCLIKNVLAAVQRSWSPQVHALQSYSILYHEYIISMDPSFVDGGTLSPPTPKHSASLKLKWSHFLSRHGILCAICWVKHTGPLLECRDSACLERNKSLQAVAWVALWHYSLRRGMVLMLTNTGEQGSFTTHPLSAVPILHRLQGHFSPSQGYICIQLPKIELYGCWVCLIHTYYLLRNSLYTHSHTFICRFTDNKMTMVLLKTTFPLIALIKPTDHTFCIS